jgi:hypothetical protein
MATAPQRHRSFHLELPRLPLPAILAFVVAGLGGSIFLTYATFTHAEGGYSVSQAQDVPVYSARAVPFDNPREDVAQRAASVARALTVAQSDVRRVATLDAERPVDPADLPLLAESERSLRGFDRFTNFAGANTYLAVAGTTSGFSAQSAPSGFEAPDAETLTAAPVPEASTWMCGAALFLLIGARGFRAHLHRNRRRD